MMQIPAPFWSALAGGATDPYFSSVSLLVQGGADTSTTLNDLSSYATSAVATANASFSSAETQFGANMLKQTSIGPAIAAFTGVGAASRFTRPSGESQTIECYYEFTTLAAFANASYLWWWSVLNGDGSINTHIADMYVKGVTNKLALRIGTTVYDTTATFSSGTRYFIQITVVGNTYTVDVDGTEVLTGTWPTTSSAGTTEVKVGTSHNPDTSGPSTIAYVTPFRWTKGVARARGSVPSAAFPIS